MKSDTKQIEITGEMIQAGAKYLLEHTDEWQYDSALYFVEHLFRVMLEAKLNSP